MKNKMIIVMSLALILAAVLLTGCGGSGSDESNQQDLSGSKYIGKWKASKVEVSDKSGGIDDGDIVLTLNDDGTGELYSKSEEEEDNTSFTWSETENGFKTTGDVKLEFTGDENTITANVFGVEIIFERM